MCYNGVMENQEYLNQIAASSAPVKKPDGGGLSDKILSIIKSKYFLIGMIGLVGLIVIMIVASLLTPKKVDTRAEIIKLRLHSDNTIEVMDTYQPEVKSSILRSYSASLKSSLASLSSDLENYLTTKYGKKDTKADKTLVSEANTIKDGLSNELFEAKITGVLDRIYAHKMAYEITKLMNEEAVVNALAKDDTLTAALDQSYNSLEKLYDDFNNFSETK